MHFFANKSISFLNRNLHKCYFYIMTIVEQLLSQWCKNHGRC